ESRCKRCGETAVVRRVRRTTPLVSRACRAHLRCRPLRAHLSPGQKGSSRMRGVAVGGAFDSDTAPPIRVRVQTDPAMPPGGVAGGTTTIFNGPAAARERRFDTRSFLRAAVDGLVAGCRSAAP